MRMRESGPPTSAAPPSTPAAAYHLRRAHSDLPFHIPKDLGFAADEIVGSEDDLCSSFVYGVVRRAAAEKGEESRFPDVAVHRHCSAADVLALGGDGVFGEITEVKKAMAADKMAELALIDPKRAKRLSAARSKLRKVHYLLELEHKVQSLQKEAATLSAQLTLFQRDTAHLLTENTQLKLRLQAKEEHTQLQEAVNEALKQEIERLKEISNTCDSFISGVHHMCRSPTTACLFTQQAGTLPHYSTQATMRNANQTCSFSNIMQQDLFGWFQRLEPMKFC